VASEVRKYSDLIVWQKAMDLVEEVYRVSQKFPREEIYGLTAQLRRSVVSIPSNIAEGQSRKGSREFLHHLSIARGSLSELETQLIIASRLKYLHQGTAEKLTSQTLEIGRLIHGLSTAITKKLAQ
jgi:four helix bundle protein